MNLLLETIPSILVQGTEARKVAAYSAWLTLTREAELSELRAHNTILRLKPPGPKKKNENQSN